MKRNGGGFLPLLCAVVVLSLNLASCGPAAEDGAGVSGDAAPASAAPAAEENSAQAASRNEGETHIVEIREFKFIPEIVTVKAGDRIVWRNMDIVPHTATEASRAWDSGNLGKDAEWSMTIETPGTSDYICAYHPSMKGKIVVSQ